MSIIRVGEEVSGELKKKIAYNILNSDIQTLEEDIQENIFRMLCLTL